MCLIDISYRIVFESAERRRRVENARAGDAQKKTPSNTVKFETNTIY